MADNLRQNADGTTDLVNTADAVPDMRTGGPASPTAASPRHYVERIAKMTANGGTDTGGGVLSWQNNTGGDVIVNGFILDVTTKATGACTLDIGITAVSGTTSANTLLTGVDVGTATGTFDNITNKGASGKSVGKVVSGAWVTASKATGASAGLIANAYIEYFPV